MSTFIMLQRRAVRQFVLKGEAFNFIGILYLTPLPTVGQILIHPSCSLLFTLGGDESHYSSVTLYIQ